MNLTYRKMESDDIEILSPIMKAAFDADTKMHTDLDEDGPWGYDNGELLRKLIALENAESEVIFADGIPVGGYTVIKAKKAYVLDMLFLAPSFGSRGIGSEVWKHIEGLYAGETKNWIVETPDYSLRNHHFYEKCGFQKYKEQVYEDGAKSYLFMKQNEQE